MDFVLGPLVLALYAQEVLYAGASSTASTRCSRHRPSRWMMSGLCFTQSNANKAIKPEAKPKRKHQHGQILVAHDGWLGWQEQ